MVYKDEYNITTTQGKKGYVSYLINNISIHDTFFNLGKIENGIFTISSNKPIESFPDLSSLSFVHTNSSINDVQFYEYDRTINNIQLNALYLKYNYHIEPNKTTLLVLNCKLPKIFERMIFSTIECYIPNLACNLTIYPYNNSYIRINCKNISDDIIKLSTYDLFGKLNVHLFDYISNVDLQIIGIHTFNEINNSMWHVYLNILDELTEKDLFHNTCYYLNKIYDKRQLLNKHINIFDICYFKTCSQYIISVIFEINKYRSKFTGNIQNNVILREMCLIIFNFLKNMYDVLRIYIL